MPGLAAMAEICGGRLAGIDAEFSGAVIDSRKCGPGQLFVALPGAQCDGHDFVSAAADAGAAGALVAREVEDRIPQVVVEDVLPALQKYAAAYRQEFAGPVVGITGSNGKTTTKEILAAVLRHVIGPEMQASKAEVLFTQGNLNNHIGVPLTLLGLRPEHQAAVIEMGANHPGEIALLTAIAKPDIGIVTMAGASHLEGFGSIEGVARAKGELFDGLPETGTAIINADDEYADLWRDLAGARRQLTFGLATHADIRADSIRREDGHQQFRLHTPQGEADVALPLSGRHNVVNALAASAAALALDLPVEKIAEGLTHANAVGGRLRVFDGPGGARIVDDSYNANPTSVKAALDWLSEQPGRRWVVLGDMAELGEGAAGWHRKVGEWLRQAGVQKFLAVGELVAETVESFGEGAEHCSDHEEAVEQLTQALNERSAADVTLLVKGSRSMRMERVVQTLTQAVDTENKSGAIQTGQVVNGG